tara:strand:+ start:387 stop:668 length:282 start_codon:yes stop_codon:yes gene_type:complete
MIQKKILKLIQSKINVEYIDINDFTSKHKKHKHYDQGGHYTLIVVSNDFKNISLLERHKIIYNILNDMLKKEIHALSITAKTIDEYYIKKEAR